MFNQSSHFHPVDVHSTLNHDCQTNYIFVHDLTEEMREEKREFVDHSNNN